MVVLWKGSTEYSIPVFCGLNTHTNSKEITKAYSYIFIADRECRWIFGFSAQQTVFRVYFSRNDNFILFSFFFHLALFFPFTSSFRIFFPSLSSPSNPLSIFIHFSFFFLPLTRSPFISPSLFSLFSSSYPVSFFSLSTLVLSLSSLFPLFPCLFFPVQLFLSKPLSSLFQLFSCLFFLLSSSYPVSFFSFSALFLSLFPVKLFLSCLSLLSFYSFPVSFSLFSPSYPVSSFSLSTFFPAFHFPVHLFLSCLSLLSFSSFPVFFPVQLFLSCLFLLSFNSFLASLFLFSSSSSDSFFSLSTLFLPLFSFFQHFFSCIFYPCFHSFTVYLILFSLFSYLFLVSTLFLFLFPHTLCLGFSGSLSEVMGLIEMSYLSNWINTDASLAKINSKSNGVMTTVPIMCYSTHRK